MNLSSFSVEKAKPREKPYKLSDGNGLHILINPKLLAKQKPLKVSGSVE
jgi:hypothetical protein